MLAISRIILIILLNHASFAESPVKKKCDYNDWRCRGSFYLSAGALLGHLFFTNNAITLLSSYTTTPERVFPNNLVGIRVGFGNRIYNHPRFTYEINYNQLFPAIKNDHDIKVVRTSKALSLSLGYSLNPGNRLEGRLVANAIIDSGYNRISGLVDGYYHTNSINFTEIFPAVGISGTFHVNSRFSFKVTELYQIIHYNVNANAAIVSALSLQYYPAL